MHDKTHDHHVWPLQDSVVIASVLCSIWSPLVINNVLMLGVGVWCAQDALQFFEEYLSFLLASCDKNFPLWTQVKKRWSVYSRAPTSRPPTSKHGTLRFKLVANNLGKCLVSILFSSMSVCEFKSVEVLRKHMLGEDYLLVLLVNDLLQPEQTLDLASIQVS